MISAYSAYGPGGASTKVRLYDWFDHLGLTVERNEYLRRNANPASALARAPLAVATAERDLRRRARDVGDDIVMVSREVSPLSSGTLEARLLAGARRGVFDFDDAIWLPSAGPRGLIDQELKAQRAVAAADIVITGNELLADWASSHARELVIIPSCVQPASYTLKTSWEIAEAPRLVWLGSPSTESYVVDKVPALAELHRQVGATLTVISGPVLRPRTLDAWPSFIRRVEWSHEAARRELAAADIAIAPLRDDAWARGKCAYKLLQYAASQLPIIGSPVGANRVALARFDGIAATSLQDWVEGLQALVAEHSTRRRERGRASYDAVRQHYSFEAWSEAWRAAALAGYE